MKISFDQYNSGNKNHGVYQEGNEVAYSMTNEGGSSNSSDGQGLETVTEVTTTTGKLASQKHALSERKRRKRINAHYDTLRQFFPQLLKNDKASVLTETVLHLKELKTIIAKAAPSQYDEERGFHKKPCQWSFVPSENDEATVLSYCDDNKETVKAIICCEDRPNLNQDLTLAIQSVGGKIVKAMMATLGGRIKMELVVEGSEYSSEGEDNVEPLRRALKAVVENRVLGRIKIMGHGYIEPDLRRLGLKF
ncbi:transcription factor bHLH30-like [Rutidosis leptorrhynchoides]|uniref:transcription factor bHLH30-like n=1 Tax=Rutidosis leptorrhynchoides TaxID=125765 RepID=UPI003A98DE87